MGWTPDLLRNGGAKRLLVVVQDRRVAPRFDLAMEVYLVQEGTEGGKTLILGQTSAEKLCHLIVGSDLTEVVCGGIEDEHYQYLTWKKVRVIDNVIGPLEWVLGRWREGRLQPGDIFDHCGGESVQGLPASR
jgi:hypothetical protein